MAIRVPRLDDSGKLDPSVIPSGVAGGPHTHTIADITNLQTTLDAKITGFADPNADRIVFWDDSAGGYAALTPGTGITITGTTITASGGTAATETAAGIVELATVAETTTGTDTVRAVTPAGVKAVADTKAATAHTHTIANITNLQTTLDAKVDDAEIGNPDLDLVAIYETALATP